MGGIRGAADKLRAKGVSRVVYFHCDHFEPWSRGINDISLRAVERFAEMSRHSNYGRKLSLFYSTYNPCNLNLSGSVGAGASVPGDAVLFQRHTDRSPNVQDRAIEVIRPLESQSHHEVHLHVHHEWWTCNAYNLDSAVSRWVNQQNNPGADEQRLDLFIKLSTATIAAELSRPFETWGFVHGNWALCASDDQICRIQNELKILMGNGCWGDFSFPAGRSHCDPALRGPFTCLPAQGTRAFDLADAGAKLINPGVRAIASERFFIWNSPLGADYSSLDYYDEGNRRRFQEPMRFIDTWIEQCVQMDGVLFLKTHSHSLKYQYGIGETDAPIPHVHSDVVRIFELFNHVCDAANVEITFATVNEVFKQMTDIDSGNLSGVPEHREPDFAVPAIDNIRRVEKRIAKHITDWVRQTPNAMDSIGDFYSLRMQQERDIQLQNYERKIVEYVLDRYNPEEVRIVEIGPGLGLMSGILARFGYDVVAVEGNALRFEALSDLARYINKSEFGGHFYPIKQWFPNVATGELLCADKRNIAILTNVVNSRMARMQEPVLQNLRIFDDVLMDVSRFGIVRDAEQSSKFALDLASALLVIGDISVGAQHHLIHFSFPNLTDGDGPAQSTAGDARSSLAAFREHAEHVQTVRQRLAIAQQIPSDSAYDKKILDGRFVEAGELNAVTRVLAHVDPGTATICEIGCGQGGLAATLGLMGYTVLAFDGSVARAAAASALVREMGETLRGRVRVVAGLFPTEFNPEMIEAGRIRVGFASDLISSFSSTNQGQILKAAAAHFDEIVIDVARFGVMRDTIGNKDGFIRQIEPMFEALELLCRVDTHEFWRFSIRKNPRLPNNT